MTPETKPEDSPEFKLLLKGIEGEVARLRKVEDLAGHMIYTIKAGTVITPEIIDTWEEQLAGRS